MGFLRSSNRFVLTAGCLLALPSLQAYAMPPIGYTGPAPVSTLIPAPAPAPVAEQTVLTAPPLGYTGPAPVMAKPVTVQPVAPVAPMLPPVASGTPKANAVPPERGKETFISAQQMHSDSANNVVVATGKVEIVRGDYVLHADKVTYNQATGVMTADGHVAMLTPSGEVQFSNHEEITGDMKQGFASNVGILFPDNSRMAAKESQRYDERYTVADTAVYTACNVCREHPEQEPLWQMNSGSITHDNVAHELYYHDTTIDFAGVPVAYTPYMSGPDPTVERQTGFLSPMPGVTGNIGSYIRTPYYIDLAPDKDMTVTPTFSTTDFLQMETQYRQRFDQGYIQAQGSITNADLVSDTGVDEGHQWRGHFFGDALYNIDNIWRAGTDVQYSSDKSYLERYQISSLDQTTSRAYVEGFQGRDYMALNSYYFQDLRAGNDASEPVVLPSATFSALGDPNSTFGGRWSFDGNTLITQRQTTGPLANQEGQDTRRLSLNGGWDRQLISQTGLVADVSGLMRTDSYLANNVIANDGSGQVYNNANFTREFEQGNIVLRYPMGRSGNGYQQSIEPIVAVTGAPAVRQITKQPVEDSLDVQFDETNLFSPNRYTGSDLIEGGSRTTYGLRNEITTDSGAHVDVFGGESYNFTREDNFPALSGLNGYATDYVGRIDFAPTSWVNANYGFRLAQKDLSPQQQDATLTGGVPLFKPSIQYIEAYETDTTTGLLDQVKQITFGLSSTFQKYWTVSGQHTQSFEPQPGPRSSGVSLNYMDECFGAGVNLSRDETSRVDISSGTSVSFHFFLKNLGGIHTDSTAGLNFPAEFRQTEP